MENGWEYAEGETGIKPVDKMITQTLAFEKSHLGNPILQVTLLGLAAYGAYALVTKFVIK
jgi:hypothetical protein